MLYELDPQKSHMLTESMMLCFLMSPHKTRCPSQDLISQAMLLCAGAAVLSKGDVTHAELSNILTNLPYAISSAALHAPMSSVPLSGKLASCRLLASLLPSQELCDIVLSSSTGLCISSVLHVWVACVPPVLQPSTNDD